jgi:hypothetical protein
LTELPSLKPAAQVTVLFTLPGLLFRFVVESEVCWYDENGRAGLRWLANHEVWLGREGDGRAGSDDGKPDGGSIGCRKTNLLQHALDLLKSQVDNDRFEFLTVQQAKGQTDVFTSVRGNRQLMHPLGKALDSGASLHTRSTRPMEGLVPGELILNDSYHRHVLMRRLLPEMR